MHIVKQVENDVYAICMQGKFTFNDNSAFREILEELPAAPGRHIILDMRDLEFVDSAALGMLMLAHEKAADCEKMIVIRGAAGQVLKMLTMARFDTYFTFV